MSLKDSFSTIPETVKGPKCQVGILMLSLTDEDRSSLEGVIDDPRWTGSSIWHVLRKEGHSDVTEVSIRRHRRYLCKCRPNVS
jgi:hypothetical protein